jgi:predicted metalloprotease with PDZ domain
MKKGNPVTLKALTVLLTTCLCGQLMAAASQYNNADSTIHYTIKPIPAGDRTDLEVSVRFTVQSDTAFIQRLPQDYYGTPNLYKYVTAFEGLNGCKAKATDKPGQRLVWPNANKEVSIKYILSYDPKTLDDFAFGPNVSASHFHAAGCQWLLPIGNISVKRKYKIEIIKPPKGWRFYASFAADPVHSETYDSYENLISSAIGGGQQAYTQFKIKGKPITVFVAGNYSISEDEIFHAVNKIVSLQRNWFNDYDFPFFNVTILPRTGIIAGTCIPNLFVCFIKEEITKDELTVLLSHEMFHTWLPNKIFIELPKGESDLKYEWLYEGFTDYLARKILLDAGLMPLEKFAALVNRDIINLADNPNRAATYADLISAQSSGKFGTAFKKLSYYRGALMALNWETTIQKSGKGKALKNLVKDLYDLSKTNGRLSEQAFYAIAKAYRVDAKSELDHYIIQGRPLLPLPDALGKTYQLKEVSVPSFDPGFSLEQTFKTRKITGVLENGNAFNAGLRNDMEFVSIRNSNRFGNGWSPDKPMSVTVKIDGTEKIIEYFPHGGPLVVKLYSSCPVAGN